jgi:hypothetical protein
VRAKKAAADYILTKHFFSSSLSIDIQIYVKVPIYNKKFKKPLTGLL